MPTLKGAFHRWAGHNEELHDGLSLYFPLWLRGGRGSHGGLRYPDGAHWCISAPDPQLIHRLVAAWSGSPTWAWACACATAQLLNPPTFQDGEQAFRVLSPVFIKWGNRERPARRPPHLQRPARRRVAHGHPAPQAPPGGLDDTGAAVRFDRKYVGAKTKLFRYNQVPVPRSLCPVVVTGTAEQIRFAWCVGVGHSTGIGCGALE